MNSILLLLRYVPATYFRCKRSPLLSRSNSLARASPLVPGKCCCQSSRLVDHYAAVAWQEHFLRLTRRQSPHSRCTCTKSLHSPLDLFEHHHHHHHHCCCCCCCCCCCFCCLKYLEFAEPKTISMMTTRQHAASLASCRRPQGPWQFRRPRFSVSHRHRSEVTAAPSSADWRLPRDAVPSDHRRKSVV